LVVSVRRAEPVGALGRSPGLEDHDAPSPLRSAALLILLAALVVLFCLPLFNAPFERDQGTYATIARGWMRGAVPYRDLWDNKGPLLFLWYVASFAGLGETVVAPRIAAALAVALCVPFVWDATRRLFGGRAARYAALAFALSFADVYLQVTANGEAFMLLPLTAGFWAFVVAARQGSWLWYLWAGLLTSLAVFTRQSAVLSFLGYGAWLLGIFVRHPRERRRQLAAGAALAAGAGLGALPFVLYFAERGALRDLWFAMFGFNLGWVTRGALGLKLLPMLFLAPGALAGGLLFWIAAVVGLWSLWRRNDRAAWLVIALVAASELAAQAAGRGAAHYSIQLLPGAAVAAAFGIPRMREWWQTGRRGVRVALVMAGVVTLAADLFAYARPTAQARFEVQYGSGDYARDATAAPAVARAVAALSGPRACVYNWGRSSEIYFLARRDPCSAFFYDRLYEIDKTVVARIMADLSRREPAVIFLTGTIAPPPELMRLMADRYRYVGEVGYAELFQRRPRHTARRGRG
jgi:4-amino-4-deoxy-L-arabinose transferase-like glycosyltransferase